MEFATIWQVILSLGVFTALGVSLVNAYSRWKASEAAEPHDYAKSYQVVVQTRNNLAKALEEERQCRQVDMGKLNDALIQLKSVQHDMRVYSRELKNLETRLRRSEQIMDMAKDYIQYLWMGVVELSNQLKKAGLDPSFVPDRDRFRGDTGFFSDEEWSTLEVEYRSIMNKKGSES